MDLLQQNISMSKDAMFISAISALVTTIVFLALWIKKMYNNALKKVEEHNEKLLDVIKENTQVNTEMKAAIQANTLATTNGAEQTSRSMDRFNNTVENLNREVLRQRGGDR